MSKREFGAATQNLRGAREMVASWRSEPVARYPQGSDRFVQRAAGRFIVEAKIRRYMLVGALLAVGGVTATSAVRDSYAANECSPLRTPEREWMLHNGRHWHVVSPTKED